MLKIQSSSSISVYFQRKGADFGVVTNLRQVVLVESLETAEDLAGQQESDLLNWKAESNVGNVFEYVCMNWLEYANIVV